MSNALAELLIAHSPDAVIATSTEGRVRFWNPGACEMFGYQAEEALEADMTELIVPASRKAEQEHVHVELLNAGVAVFESMRRRQDGSLLYVDISARRIQPEGEPPLLLYIKKDVTELKVRRDAKWVQASFGQLLDSTPDGIVLVNATGRVVLANRQATQMFGYDDDELVGKPVEQLLPPRFRHAHVGHRIAYIDQPRIRAMGAGLDLFGLRKNGEEFPVEISLSPLRSEEGALIFSAIRDITERKRFEIALRDTNAELARASAAKDRFLAGMSHELRTPLNAIIGFTGTLLMRLPGPLNEDQERHLSTVKANAKHLLSLINDLLDLAKIEAGKHELSLEEVDPAALLDEVASALRLQAERKQLELRVEMDGEPQPFVSDQRILRQILLNLTHNAIKFTARGSVRLRYEACSHNDSSRHGFHVIDTGVGISSSDQQLLFAPFSRLQQAAVSEQEGSGLGLHLSQQMAELVDGEIVVESRPGEGSCFSIVLRRAA